MPTKITVTNPQPITVKVSTGKDQVVHSSTTFVGSANNFLPDTGGSLSGNLIVQGSITTNTITILGNTYTGNILPTADKVYNIGSPTLRYKTLYLAGNTIDLGGGTISANGDRVVLTSPSGGTLFFTGNANTTVDAAAGERAETTANAAYDLSTASFYYSGTAVYAAEDATNLATSAYDQANTAYDYGAAAFYYSASAVYTSQDANTAAQTANNTATTAAQLANDAYDLSTSAFYYSGTALYTAQDASNTAQSAALSAQTAFEAAQTASETANTAILTANAAYEIANGIVLINYVQRIGDTVNGAIIFTPNLQNYTVNTAIGQISSSNGLDVFAANALYAQLNYENVHKVSVNVEGVYISTSNDRIELKKNEGEIRLNSSNLFSLFVNGFEAITVNANNDIYLNGTIYGAPTALDGGDF